MSALPMFQRIGGAAYKVNLNNTIELLEHLKNPHKNFQSIHIAGTNGKGSVSHWLASVFQEAGYKTGLYTSPHLSDFRERIRINGIMIEKSYVTKFIEKNKSILDKIKPSFFEMSVGLCFQYFSDKEVDIAIIETGMGGRLDSTNIIEPVLSVITNISYDHTEFLGDTLEKIAIEKAGIIKPQTPVIIGETHDETKNIFIEISEKNNSHITFADNAIWADVLFHSLIHPKLKIKVGLPKANHIILSPLAGEYQIKNLKTVLAAALKLRNLGYKIHISHIKKGIANVVLNTSIRGRWMQLNNRPAIIADTGHNADGITSISKMLKSMSYSTLHIVLGMVSDKNHISILKLLPQNARYYFCRPSVPRGFDAFELQAKAKEVSLIGDVYESVEAAVLSAFNNAKTSDIIFIGGSTFTVADALNIKDFDADNKNSKHAKIKQLELKF